MKLKFILLLFFVLLSLTGLIVVYFYINNKDMPPTVPKDIVKKISFTIYGPDQSNLQNIVWKIDPTMTTYDNDAGILTLNINNTNINIILTQQSTPDSFTDIPGQYSRMLNLLNQYAELQTSFSTITLTKPKELNGAQSAVANKGGTLMFAKPNIDLTDAEWKDFFKTFVIIRG